MGMNVTLQEMKNGFQNIFMLLMLPPIIFESIINMHRGSIYQNIESIGLFSILGTLVATFVGAFLIYFFSLFSKNDVNSLSIIQILSAFL